MASREDTASTVSRILVPAFALLVGCSLIGLALPRAAAYFTTTSWRHFSQAGPEADSSAADVDALLASYRAATDWQPGDATLQKTRGQLALLALRPGRSDLTALKGEAASALRAAIVAAPNDACAWAIYAYAGTRYALADVTIEPSLRLAYILSPPTPPCATLRLSAMLARPAALPEDLKPYVEADLRSLWATPQYRPSLAYVYRDAPPAGQALMRATLSTETRSSFDVFLRGQGYLPSAPRSKPESRPVLPVPSR